MESEPFQVNPKMMGRDVVLPGLLDRALGPAINATPEEIQRATTSYGAEATNPAAGFRTEIPFTGDVVPVGNYPPTMLSVVPRVNVDRLALTWLLQTARTAPAGMQVAEGGTAPEATFTWTPQRINLRRVRAWVPVTEDALASEMLLQTLIETDLVGIVREAGVASQIVQGDGSGQQHQRLRHHPRGSAERRPTIGNANPGESFEAGIQAALLRVKRYGFTMASHIVVQPEAFDPMMNLQRDGWYLFSPVADPAMLRYRGVPIVETFGDFVTYADGAVSGIVGDFSRYSRFFTMGDVSIASTMSHGTLFIDFEVAFRAGIWCEYVGTRNGAFCTLTRSD